MASPRQTGGAAAAPASVSALLGAAGEMLTERSPSAISGRELAGVAGVNYGLVHRYFGSKSELLGRAFDALLADYAQSGLDPDGVPVPLQLSRHPAWRALTHVTLDRDGFGEYRPTTPILDRCIAGIASARPELDRDQVHAVVGLGLAIEAGLPIHRPVLAPALGLAADDSMIDELVGGWLAGLYRGHGPLGPVPEGAVADPMASRPVVEISLGADAAVDERLVAAGAGLLVERAPAAITGRHLAQAAGVNYGLIHHYFGSKDEVLRRSVQLHRDRFFDAHAGPGWSPRFFSICEHPGYVRAMTWHALDPALAEVPQRFPVTDQMVERLVDDADADLARAQRIAILTVVSLQMAWALFVPVLQQAFGREARPLEPLVTPLLRNLLVDPMQDRRVPTGTLST